ncbi:unnamed protein product [Leptidea sinapis]|uniref:Tyrosine-protein phosphatase domain-containing protein n=1 Tax=Leptidea sinapis TaxID=189913 RepID=A0A5E4QVS2_9NEOP|nr:unnamed protein product [Leptidea sinapis]
MAGVKAPPKTVQLFQLTCWPMGHKVPSSTNSLVELMNMVERWRQRTDYGPVCVVSPRAGVYCAANACIEQVIQHGEVDVFQAVKTVRRHRPQLVENMTEYKYCYDLVLHYLKDELWFIEFGRGPALPTTPEETSPTSLTRQARNQQRPARPRRGLSLDRLLPSTARPPLPHAFTMEAPRRPRRDRPPLRRSIRLEDDDAAADERRRVFGHGPRAASFDEGDVSDEHEECECQRMSLERSGPSADTPDDNDLEPEFVASPPYDAPQQETKIRGASADRILEHRERTLTPRGPPRAHSQGVFERRLPKIYKLGLIDKSKRASSSALYERVDRSPTEAFYNATGSTRLSSHELFEKFCSEDFTSLYGRVEYRPRRPPHSKSTGSSGSDVRHERTCCRRVPCTSQPALSRRHIYAPRSDRSTDSDDTSPGRTNIRSPLQEQHSEDYSRSAPLLSPDKFEARFTFDISEHSEVTSNRDETPSDATETRNLTLYEEPYSDRTSICELYDAAFTSHRPSFKRNGSRRQTGQFDLTNLDFRPIDDESPRTSRRTSHRSIDDTLRQASESRSWASDSVFATPERRVITTTTTSPSSTDTRKYLTAQCDLDRADSAAADSTQAETTLAEELPSVVERSEYTLALKLGRIDLDETSVRSATPPASALERISSRPSMLKLEPIEPERRCGESEEAQSADSTDPNVEIKRRRRGASEPRRSTRCFPL